VRPFETGTAEVKRMYVIPEVRGSASARCGNACHAIEVGRHVFATLRPRR
jgi:hypothetical protein